MASRSRSLSDSESQDTPVAYTSEEAQLEETQSDELQSEEPPEEVLETEVLATDLVENFDNSGNGVTDNKPLDWDEKAPEGTVIYGPDSAIPSENAVVSGTVSTAVYATENEFDDKGLADPPVEEVEPPDPGDGEEETEPPV